MLSREEFQNCNRVLITICKDNVILAYNFFIDMFNKYHTTETKLNDSELNVIVFQPNEIKKFENIVDNLQLSEAILNMELNITLQLTNKI